MSFSISVHTLGKVKDFINEYSQSPIQRKHIDFLYRRRRELAWLAWLLVSMVLLSDSRVKPDRVHTCSRFFFAWTEISGAISRMVSVFKCCLRNQSLFPSNTTCLALHTEISSLSLNLLKQHKKAQFPLSAGHHMHVSCCSSEAHNRRGALKCHNLRWCFNSVSRDWWSLTCSPSTSWDAWCSSRCFITRPAFCWLMLKGGMLHRVKHGSFFRPVAATKF